MIERRDDDFVAFVNVLPTPGSGHKVNRFGSPANKNNFLMPAVIDELPHLSARVLICCRCALAQFMNAPVNVGAISFVIVAEAFDNTSGFLRRCCVVQVHERMAMYGLMKCGEV